MTNLVRKKEKESPHNTTIADSENQSSSVPTPQPTKLKRKKPPLEKLTALAGHNYKVLIVDDNCVNRKIVAKMLDFFGLEHVSAKDGQEAVDWVVQQSRGLTGNPEDPHVWLILMDLSMPVMDGFDAIRVLRTTHHMTIPIVALTANALSEEAKRALEVGATEFRSKPIMRHDLHAICRNFLEVEKKGREYE